MREKSALETLTGYGIGFDSSIYGRKHDRLLEWFRQAGQAFTRQPPSPFFGFRNLYDLVPCLVHAHVLWVSMSVTRLVSRLLRRCFIKPRA